MRGVFFGTSAFAVPALRAFAERVTCELVVTQPDRPSGRGHRVTPTPVKLAAQSLGIATIEPARMAEGIETIAAVGASLFAVASYGKILPQRLLDLAPAGALNVHPSLLPLYRGATPLQSQLRDGVTRSGVTIIFMDAGMDTGDIVLVRESAVGTAETYGEVHDRFALLGAEMLGEACALVASGAVTRTPQAGLADPAEVARTVTRPLARADLIVDWSWPAKRITDHVRSLSPAPGARARLDCERDPVKLLAVHPATGDEAGEFLVPCGRGEFVAVDRLVPPNRAAMSGRAYRAPIA